MRTMAWVPTVRSHDNVSSVHCASRHTRRHLFHRRETALEKRVRSVAQSRSPARAEREACSATVASMKPVWEILTSCHAA